MLHARRRKLAVLLIFLALGAQACGKSPNYHEPAPVFSESLDQFNQSFTSGFNDPKVYEANYCQTNIWHLTKILRETSATGLNFAHVLYLLPEDEPSLDDNASALDSSQLIFPKRARDSVGSWAFHVVLELGGKIWDFDYKDQPTVVSRQEYFKEMFAGEDIGKMHLRIIPAKEYISDYDEAGEKNVYFYTSAQNSLYPRIKLTDFINRS